VGFSKGGYDFSCQSMRQSSLKLNSGAIVSAPPAFDNDAPTKIITLICTYQFNLHANFLKLTIMASIF
jgi:hypothetical protein